MDSSENPTEGKVPLDSPHSPSSRSTTSEGYRLPGCTGTRPPHHVLPRTELPLRPSTATLMEHYPEEDIAPFAGRKRTAAKVEHINEKEHKEREEVLLILTFITDVKLIAA